LSVYGWVNLLPAAPDNRARSAGAGGIFSHRIIDANAISSYQNIYPVVI
jgi:hypothetical protein